MIKISWSDLKVKIIVLTTLFISVISVIILVALDFQRDREVIRRQADKYETYIDQLLLEKYSYEELKDMGAQELKIAIDMAIDQESQRVLNAPTLRDFLIPVKDDNYATTFKITRNPRDKWSKEEIEQFWIDLEDLDLDKLDERNLEYLKARLKDIN